MFIFAFKSFLFCCLCAVSSFAHCEASKQALPLPQAKLTPQQFASVYHGEIELQQYWVSEKLDGIRARWNGSQLVTRTGHVINAPAWFVNGFPAQTLDGELWLARNSFEQTVSIVMRDIPGEDWQKIQYRVFDLPAGTGTFTQRLSDLQRLVSKADSPYLQLIPQFKLTDQPELMAKLDELVAQGAEGLMLHHQDALYQDGRSSNLLKLKKYQDAEATVIDQLVGKGKYHNMLGSLLVELDNGIQFKIGSGFSDAQRLKPPPIGSIITFKYYGLTAKGIPRFASFLRVKPVAELSPIKNKP